MTRPFSCLLVAWALPIALVAATAQLVELDPYDNTVSSTFWDTTGRKLTTVCREEGTFAGALDTFGSVKAEGTALIAIDAFSRFVIETVCPTEIDTTRPGMCLFLR